MALDSSWLVFSRLSVWWVSDGGPEETYWLRKYGSGHSS